MTLRSKERRRVTSLMRCRGEGCGRHERRRRSAVLQMTFGNAVNPSLEAPWKNILFFTVPKVICSTALLVFGGMLGAQEAQKAPLAERSLLLDIAAAGKRLVAVGDRGHVLLSDDAGGRWRQAQGVPAQTLLTAVCFGDARHGIAVGHDELILVTKDAGESWQRTHYAPQAQQPLLDVWCGGD